MCIEEKFSKIYDNNSWLSKESRSGNGSNLCNNKNFLLLLTEFIKIHNVKKIIDCGCGDFNWMKHFDFDLIDSYIGIDIVESLIKTNNSKYSNDKITFINSDIISDNIEKCDLILCKDVLFHLSFEHSFSFLNNIKDKFTFFVSTTFHDFVNYDISTGQWRPINLEFEPFLMGQPYRLWKNIENRNDQWINKSIGIWKKFIPGSNV